MHLAKRAVMFTLMVAGAVILLKLVKPYAPSSVQGYLPA